MAGSVIRAKRKHEFEEGLRTGVQQALYRVRTKKWTLYFKNVPSFRPFLQHFLSFWQSLCTSIWHKTTYFWLVLSKISKIAWKIGQKWDKSVKEGVHFLVRTLYNVYYLKCLCKAIDFQKCLIFSHVNEAHVHKMYFNFVL